MKRVDPVFHLTHGLDDASKNQRINPKRYGVRTWFDAQRHRFSMFNLPEVRGESSQWDRSRIDQALTNYWQPRVRDLE